MNELIKTGEWLLKEAKIRPSTANLIWAIAKFVCLVRDNYTCQSCGYTEVDTYGIGKTQLVVHHLDKSGTGLHPNHKLENLQTLCQFCHSGLHKAGNYPVNFFEAEEMRKNNPSMSMAEIGRRLGLSRERVRQLLKRAGLPTKVHYNKIH